MQNEVVRCGFGNIQGGFQTFVVGFDVFWSKKRTRKMDFRGGEKRDFSTILPCLSHSRPIHASYSVEESMSYKKSIFLGEVVGKR